MPKVMKPADVLWLHLFYHDLHTALMQKKGATAAAFKSSGLRAAEARWGTTSSSITPPPQGRHGATPSRCIGSSLRLSARRWKRQALCWTGESPILANKDDPHTIKVFDPSIKGETDRFAYRFVRR